jgi:hypothetical protein
MGLVMEHKELTWQDVYQLPLRSDVSSYLWAGDNVMAIQFKPSATKEDRTNILELINGTGGVRMKGVNKDGVTFYRGEEELFFVRGWGHLTGSAALDLDNDKAIEIQNGFIDHVLKSISEC